RSRRLACRSQTREMPRSLSAPARSPQPAQSAIKLKLIFVYISLSLTPPESTVGDRSASRTAQVGYGAPCKICKALPAREAKRSRWLKSARGRCKQRPRALVKQRAIL